MDTQSDDYSEDTAHKKEEKARHATDEDDYNDDEFD